MDHRHRLVDSVTVADEANLVCTHCSRPELFCECQEGLERALTGAGD